MTNPVDAAIAAAQAAAATTPATAPVPVPVAPQAGAVATVPARGTPMTLADLNTGGLTVDHFLKVNQFGLTFDKDETLHQEILVDIDLSRVVVCETIKFGKNPVNYLKTYDGVVCASGGSWAAAVQRAQAIEPGARPYKSVEIPMTNVSEIKLKDKVIPAGAKIGHSTSTTNKAHFQSLLDDVAKAGLTLTSTVRVKIGRESKEKNGNKWGLVTFKLEGASPAVAQAA
jgi:hypothetical protein